MASLQEQLLKAGLTTEKALKQAKKEKKPQQKVAKDLRNQASETQLAAAKARAEQAARDRELNKQRDAEQLKRAIAAQIKQMIETHRVARSGEISFNFVDGKQVKKMNLTQPLIDQLTRGQLAIVRLGEGYELIPALAAKKIAERDAASVVLLNDGPQHTTDASEEDDPYKDFVIPDDLMW